MTHLAYSRRYLKRLPYVYYSFRVFQYQKDAVSPGADLEEMQSLLYLIEEGNAHRRQGKLHHALKKYHAVRKVSCL